MNAVELHLAQIVPCTEAEGPGRRFAVWFQGCPLRCPGCCNPEMLPFDGGHRQSLDEVIDQLESALPLGIEGITLLGGEPFAHAPGAAELAAQAHALDLSVMVFTGFLIEDLKRHPDPGIQRLLDETDILVDGPYRHDLPERARRWIGSANQRVHHLTRRSCPDDPRWQAPNTLELRLSDGVLTVNGFPAPKAAGLWRRPRGARP